MPCDDILLCFFIIAGLRGAEPAAVVAEIQLGDGHDGVGQILLLPCDQILRVPMDGIGDFHVAAEDDADHVPLAVAAADDVRMAFVFRKDDISAVQRLPCEAVSRDGIVEPSVVARDHVGEEIAAVRFRGEGGEAAQHEKASGEGVSDIHDGSFGLGGCGKYKLFAMDCIWFFWIFCFLGWRSLQNFQNIQNNQ